MNDSEMIDRIDAIHAVKNSLKVEPSSVIPHAIFFLPFEIFEISINAGAKDCINLKNYFEIITEKEDFYKIKTILEKKIDIFSYFAIEWRATNLIDLNKEQSEKALNALTALEELDDVQNIFTNANLEKVQI